jgi:hypothetical protein
VAAAPCQSSEEFGKTVPDQHLHTDPMDAKGKVMDDEGPP